MALLLIVAAVLGPALADGDNPVARWMRGGTPTVIEPHADPALPGPPARCDWPTPSAAATAAPVCPPPTPTDDPEATNPPLNDAPGIRASRPASGSRSTRPTAACE